MFGHFRRSRTARSNASGGAKVLLVCVLVALGVIVVDTRGAGNSALDPVREAVGTAVGPVEVAADTVVRPFRGVASALSSNRKLRHDVAELQAKNSALKGQLTSAGVDRNRLDEYDGLVRTSKDTGYALVPSRVIGVGPAQSFSRTVTIDAGRDSGIKPDSTVVNNDGLVGRVLRVSKTTATVLLICDTDSVVGARMGSTMKIGFLKGRGTIGQHGRLDLELVDNSATPARRDTVVSWGSAKGGPYVAGVPIGTVQKVYSSPRELSKRAVIDPFVDFSSLDMVGIVVPAKTHSDRALIHPDGKVR